MLPKSENKPSGLRRFFSRKKRSSRSTQDSTIPSEAARHTEQKEARQSRQSYRPRYADRDMILSVPVEQRPDLVVRAKEASLQRECSDIGFNTIASSSRSSFATASSSSQTQSDVSMHPILQQRRQVAMQTRTAASSDVDSLSHHSGRMSGYSRSISMPSTLLKQTGCATENYWRGMNLGPRGKTAQLDDAQIERVDHALKKIGRLESERASEQHLTSLSSPGAGYAANANHRLTAASSSSPRQSRLYFGHSNTAPDLRATRDKGKGRAVESQGQYNHGTLLSSSPYCLEARQSYAISHAVLTPGQRKKIVFVPVQC